MFLRALVLVSCLSCCFGAYAAEHPVEIPLTASLGGMPLKANAQIMDLAIDGNIGAPVLKQWVITLDLPHQRLWLAPGHHN